MSDSWEFGEAPEQTSQPAFPWPPPEDEPILAAFGATWKGSTFDPGVFFAGAPRKNGTGAALVYLLVVGMLLAGATLFWDSMSFMAGSAAEDPMAAFGLGSISPLVRFLLAPVLLLATLYVSAGVVHVLLLIFDGAHNGFGTTVRVFCYAYSPALFGVVPYIGALVGGIWSLVLVIIGLRTAHEAAAWKPAVAVLVPFFVTMAFFVLVMLTMVMAGAALTPG